MNSTLFRHLELAYLHAYLYPKFDLAPAIQLKEKQQVVLRQGFHLSHDTDDPTVEIRTVLLQHLAILPVLQDCIEELGLFVNLYVKTLLPDMTYQREGMSMTDLREGLSRWKDLLLCDGTLHLVMTPCQAGSTSQIEFSIFKTLLLVSCHGTETSNRFKDILAGYHIPERSVLTVPSPQNAFRCTPADNGQLFRDFVKDMHLEVVKTV